MGKRMLKRTTTILALLALLLSALPNSHLIGEVDAQITCCDSVEVDFYLLGEGDETGKGTLSPFSVDLTTEQDVWVTSSVSQLTEIARWRVPQATSGSYPISTWTLSVNYEVINAAGVQANVSAEVKIGGKSWSGSSNTNPAYSPGLGTVDVSIDIDEEGNILSSGELVVVVLSVQTLIFNSPDDDAGVRFIWGTDEYASNLQASIPLVKMDWQPAVVNGHSVQIPVVLRSGFGAAIWEKSTTEFKIDGVVVDTVVATMHNDGAQVYLNWQAPDSSQDGVYEVNLSLTVSDSQVQPFRGGFSYVLAFGGGTGTGYGIFPADEPLRSGGSKLSIKIDAEIQGGDRIRRTTQIDLEGPMATWMRWGLDNIGNDSLDSLSQWRKVQGSSSTDATHNNQQVDSSEVQALETYLSGRASSLKQFMFDGLMLDSGRLLGVEPIEAAASPTVSIDVNDDYGFSDSTITITIESLENIKVGEKSILFDNFVRPQASATPFWSELTIEARLGTSMMVGTSAVDGSGIDYSHKRFIYTETVTVSKTTLVGEEAMSDYRVAYVIGSLTHSPLVTLLQSFAMFVAFTLLARKLTKDKPRVGFWLTSVLFAVVWGYSYFFALPLAFMLVALGVAGVMMLAVAVVTPKISLDDSLADEAAYITIMPSRGSRKKRVKIPVVRCPVCAESIAVKTMKRPARVRCDGCDTRLKIS
ncbi:MAG: hypothetical protein CXX81_00935 [Methanobacteriota archaeon]|nr:MAG: hypothetical protein CXX81_25090 [Euryarchaeota archaeon]HIA24942.1 hypothetical protein [Candidatus Poseidoniales archaeon]PXY76535.1 MAG: hypothetical protein CXX81_14330 [Euryarchaeota archaeon]PXY78103.1 MAG: hypothetical protein CXX81_09525 [Euryarchaeota archaeon]PXY79703.1 MAG: hypothetical protein CXX81_00935 [Euryarchaeota archaeon]